MTDLTEQWKKGELPYAEYYIKLGGGEYTNDVLDVDGWQSFNKEGDVVFEVLAPVPSYDEWVGLNRICVKYEKENAELKEVLKKCKEIFDECFSPSAKYGELYKKINEVLK